LNFIGWQPHEGSWSADLPAGAKIRLTLQWTEAHDPVVPVEPTRYRKPLNDLQPMVVKQRDASGTKASTDDLVVVARGEPLAQLIDRTDTAATYEQIVDFTVDQPGRYAVRFEGKKAATVAPPEIKLPPAAQRTGEIFPRMHLSVTDPKMREQGRVVFLDYRSVDGGTATPGDAHSVVVIGAANATGKAQLYSARASVPSLALIPRPSTLAFDEHQFGTFTGRGTAVANGFAAGTLAAMLSAGAPASSELRWLKLSRGELFQVPPVWLQQLQNKTGLRERAAYLASPLDRPVPHNR